MSYRFAVIRRMQEDFSVGVVVNYAKSYEVACRKSRKIYNAFAKTGLSVTDAHSCFCVRMVPLDTEIGSFVDIEPTDMEKRLIAERGQPQKEHFVKQDRKMATYF